MCYYVCVCTVYLKESWRDWSHWHALSWRKVPQDRAGSCCSTLKDAKTHFDTRAKKQSKYRKLKLVCKHSLHVCSAVVESICSKY